MSEKIAYAIKHYTWVQFLYVHIMSFVFRVLGVFVGNDDHLVLLSSMSGDQYTGSPRVMFEKMKTDPRFDGFRYIWAFSVPGKYETPGAEQVKINSLAYFIVALRARIWITDVNIERGLHFKKKSTIYFNAWHGTGPKKCGNSVSNRKDYDFSYVDILCVDGDYLKKVYVDSFNAREESMIWCGRPREDVLFTYSEEDKKHIRRELGIPDDKKVILYMPTWRENGNHGLDWLQWEREFEDDYVMLVRSHHFSKSDIFAKLNSKFWINVSDYSDVNELYLVSDILISDYSSAFFDFGLLSKPIICFADDYDDFIANGPGLYMDMKRDFPGGVQETDEQAIAVIKNMDYAKACIMTKQYIDCYIKRPKNATDVCLNRIYELLRS